MRVGDELAQGLYSCTIPERPGERERAINQEGGPTQKAKPARDGKSAATSPKWSRCPRPRPSSSDPNQPRAGDQKFRAPKWLST